MPALEPEAAKRMRVLPMSARITYQLTNMTGLTTHKNGWIEESLGELHNRNLCTTDGRSKQTEGLTAQSLKKTHQGYKQETTPVRNLKEKKWKANYKTVDTCYDWGDGRNNHP